MEPWSLLLEVVFLLSGCLLVGGLLSRLGQSPLVGYMLAGMLLGGPGSLGLIKSPNDIEAIAELGIALLLFSLGLEFSWQRVRSFGGRTITAGVLQVVITILVAAAGGLVFGLPPVTALAAGVIVSLSSTATTLRVLMDRGEIDSTHGRESGGVLLVQDMAVVPLAVLLTLLAGSGHPAQLAVDVGRTVLLAAGLVAALYIALNQVAVRLLRALSLQAHRELAVLLAVVLGLGSAWAAHAVGLSPALGAFLAGMFLGASPFATQLRADVSSLRVVLLTLFFGAVGMLADPVWILAHLPLVLGIAALLVVGKALLVFSILRLLRSSTGVAGATGLCLAHVGEFAFVLDRIGRDSGVLGDQLSMALVSSTIITMLAAPWLVVGAPGFAALLERLRRVYKTRADGSRSPHPKAAIIGFGPAGEAVGRALTARGLSALVVDLNPRARVRTDALGHDLLVGDALQLDVLEHARLEAAEVVVVTLPGPSAAMTVLSHLRRLAPAARLLVRSRYHRHFGALIVAGASEVVDEEEEVGARLSELALCCLEESDAAEKIEN